MQKEASRITLKSMQRAKMHATNGIFTIIIDESLSAKTIHNKQPLKVKINR